MKINSTILTIVISAFILVGVITAVIFIPRKDSGSPELSAFAQCLADKGATFYGAYWCPHCRSQKALFGSSAQYLPYVECATADGQGQNQVCQQAGVTNYPTWTFADATRQVGELSLEILAEKTACPLPGSLSVGTSTTIVGSSSSAI